MTCEPNTWLIIIIALMHAGYYNILLVHALQFGTSQVYIYYNYVTVIMELAMHNYTIFYRLYYYVHACSIIIMQSSIQPFTITNIGLILPRKQQMVLS